jgi:hypothetical protein
LSQNSIKENYGMSHSNGMAGVKTVEMFRYNEVNMNIRYAEQERN